MTTRTRPATAPAWRLCTLALTVREPDGWLYQGRVRRAQLRLRIEVLTLALERDPGSRGRTLRGAGSDPFFKGLTPYEQRLVIRALDLRREEAKALFD